MQVNIEEKSSVQKILHFEIPKEDVAKELDKAYRELRKNTEIKGFRKGKIPRQILEKRFSKQVHQDVAPRMIQDAYAEILQENDFNIIGGPQADPPELDPKADYVFDITIDLKPELDDVDFKGLELKKIVREPSEDEVDTQIHMIRKNLAKKEVVTEERPVKEGDFVRIDYEGYIDDGPYDKTPKIENYVMAIGGNVLPQEFSAKLIGVIPEKELEIEVVYNDDDTNPDLAGKTVTYKVMLKEIQEEILPPADDKMAKELGQYESLEDLKKAIRDNLQKGYEQRSLHELSEQVFTQLLEKLEFEAPEVMINAELQGIIAETEQVFAQNSTSLEENGLSPEFIATQYRPVAEKQAKRHILMGKIIEQEKLELTEEELDQGFQEMAVGMGATVDAVKNHFKMDEKQLAYYKHGQLEKKAVRIIIEQGKVVEVAPDAEATIADENNADQDNQES